MVRPVRACSVLRSAGEPRVKQNPIVIRLSRRFVEIRKTAMGQGVEAAVVLGGILRQLRAELPGHYQRHLRDELDVTPVLAAQYAAVARLAEEAPTVVRGFRAVGVRKLATLARLPAAAREAVVRELRQGRAAERRFWALVEPHLHHRASSPDVRARALRRSLRAFTTRLTSQALPVPRDAQLRGVLKGDLLEASRRLQAYARQLARTAASASA